jgi:hypothetical protein
MKKILNIGMVVTLVVGLFFAITPTTLAGVWDYQGSDEFTNQSAIFKSGGGDFKICLNDDNTEGPYRLMEEDPFNPDDWVPAEVHFPQDFDSWNCFDYKDIGEYVDGSDNQAEFYLEKYSGGNSTVHAYD